MRNCTHWCIKGLLSLSVLLSALSSRAQTSLSAGDIAFTGYFSSSTNPIPDTLSFVLLTNISAGTTISFTDRGYNNTSGSWQAPGSTEGTITWVSGSAIPVGREIVIAGVSSNGGGAWIHDPSSGSRFANGTVTLTEGSYASGLNLASTGDQLIAFQGGSGSVSAGGVTILTGLHYGYCNVNTSAATWDAGCSISPNTSNIPPGLSNGYSAIYIPRTAGVTAAHGRFNCAGTPTTTVGAIRSAVMDINNWSTTPSGSPMPTSSGCGFLSSAPIVTSHPANRVSCLGATTTFAVTATGATTYQWQVNSGSGYTNITNGGVYSNVTTSALTLTGITAAMTGYQYRAVVTGTGSATSSPASLTVSSPTVVASSQTNLACNGVATGSATINTMAGGVTPYTYSWSPSGGTGPTATSLVATTYTVTITDNIGCAVTKNFTITQPTALNASTSQTNIACNGGANGAAGVTASGGTPGYTYSWSPYGGTGANATSLSAGMFTATITDANGCTASQNITITQPPAISTNGVQGNVSCNGGANGFATVNVTGGAGGYSYSWAPFGGTAASATGLPVGSYTVTITDANACNTTRNFIITQPPALNSTVSSNSPTCLNGNNGSATVSASGGAGSYMYSWSPSGGTAATATNLSAGNYNVSITDVNGCSRVQPVTISSNSPSQTGGVACTPGNSSSQSQPVGAASGNYTDGNCNRIATLTPSGSNPVSGSVATKVWVENTVPNHTGAPYVARHYEITPANNPSTASGTVKLYFLQSEFDAFNAAPGSLRKLPTGASDATGIANLRIGKYSGTSSDNSGRPASYTSSAIVINPADNNIVWNATESRWEVSFDVEGFSGFVAQTNPAILPVTLRSFTATKLDGNVSLHWNTATEQNTDRFEVERSADGRNYIKLGVEAAAGNSATGKTYTYTDAQPLAVNYYRLKMIDRNGAFAYSPVAIVKMSDKGGLDIFPNPAKGIVRVQLPANQETTLEIYSVAGRLVKSVSVARNSGNTITIDLSGLSQGHYYLKAGSETVKFTKE